VGANVPPLGVVGLVTGLVGVLVGTTVAYVVGP